MWTRRHFLAGTAALAALPLPYPAAADSAPVALVARERSLSLLPGTTTPVWAYRDDWPLVLRTRRDAPFRAVLTNSVTEHTAIHWHGIRLPNAMDGVPYMTQPPVETGESFAYEFAPPDAGTFFFHPHCNTVEQLGRGLAGVLIVEDEAEKNLFLADHVVAIKDWRLKPDGSFDAFSTDKGAARAGTFGSVETVNAKPHAQLEALAHGWVRLRVLNLDVSRIVVLALEGAEGFVIATDGNPLPPVPLKTWTLGPAMRADIAFRMPWQKVRLQNVWGSKPELLAEISFIESALPGIGSMPELAASRVPEPDLTSAQRLTFELTAGHVSPELQAYLKENDIGIDQVCLPQRTFWAINGRSWSGQDHKLKPPPLAELKRGRSYIFELFNGTPHPHPMHLHGHTFRVLRSSKKEIVPHLADTVLVGPKERVEIAFTADNPGEWMMHCHIIEHQETGMMGYVRVA
ncbi:multicopper oxidase family protein [Dongia deserti]|uniref:multicopper oxidase family protein n=1 Tax=Dongia deserti TaxID=2268030 RepID=UPI0025499AFC|nr:multicopper oxidase family protein [Dongia deserti]